MQYETRKNFILAVHPTYLYNGADMKVAVYSDIHDNLHNLKLVFAQIKKRMITTAFCLGDFINPGIIKAIIDSGIFTYAVWGNNDGEKFKILHMAWEHKNKINLARTEFAAVELDGKKAFLIHRHDFVESLAKSGDFDAVFYGHNHITYSKQFSNGCLLANPGEVSGHVTGHVSFMVWDTETDSAETIEIKNPLLVND